MLGAWAGQILTNTYFSYAWVQESPADFSRSSSVVRVYNRNLCAWVQEMPEKVSSSFSEFRRGGRRSFVNLRVWGHRDYYGGRAFGDKINFR